MSLQALKLRGLSWNSHVGDDFVLMALSYMQIIVFFLAETKGVFSVESSHLFIILYKLFCSHKSDLNHAVLLSSLRDKRTQFTFIFK